MAQGRLKRGSRSGKKKRAGKAQGGYTARGKLKKQNASRAKILNSQKVKFGTKLKSRLMKGLTTNDLARMSRNTTKKIHANIETLMAAKALSQGETLKIKSLRSNANKAIAEQKRIEQKRKEKKIKRLTGLSKEQQKLLDETFELG
eukprot:g2894.t1